MSSLCNIGRVYSLIIYIRCDQGLTLLRDPIRWQLAAVMLYIADYLSRKYMHPRFATPLPRLKLDRRSFDLLLTQNNYTISAKLKTDKIVRRLTNEKGIQSG